MLQLNKTEETTVRDTQKDLRESSGRVREGSKRKRGKDGRMERKEEEEEEAEERGSFGEFSLRGVMADSNKTILLRQLSR